MIGAFLGAGLLGLLVFFIGTFFDKRPDNKNAGLAGLIVFVVALLAFFGLFPTTRV